MRWRWMRYTPGEHCFSCSTKGSFIALEFGAMRGDGVMDVTDCIFTSRAQSYGFYVTP